MKRLLLLIKSDSEREKWLNRLAQIAISRDDPSAPNPQ